MPAKQTTLLDELSAAARGCVALLMGDRGAAGYFDFSQRGLAGSFVALLASQLIIALAPLLLGAVMPSGTITRMLTVSAFAIVVQIGISALLLRQFGRLDGLQPYLVADNWATLFITLLGLILDVIGVGPEFAYFATLAIMIVVEVNIGRLIMTLTGFQIAAFIVTQIVGIGMALLILTLAVPQLVPELATAISAAQVAAQ